MEGSMFGGWILPGFLVFGGMSVTGLLKGGLCATWAVGTVWAEPMGWVCQRSGMRRDKLWQWGLLRAR